jgi:hypothetical protein
MPLGDETKERAETEFTNLDQLKEAVEHRKSAVKNQIQQDLVHAKAQMAQLQERIPELEAGKSPDLDSCVSVAGEIDQTQKALRQAIDAENEHELQLLLDAPDRSNDVYTVKGLTLVVNNILDGTESAPG